MGTNVKVDYKALEEFQAKLEQLGEESDVFLEECAKELAARLLRKAIKRTPVGVYSGRTGGTLRRAWSKSNRDMRIISSGSLVRIEIINPTEYASYVEYGHRTRGGKGWVGGKFMMTMAIQEVQAMSLPLLQKLLYEKLMEVIQ